MCFKSIEAIKKRLQTVSLWLLVGMGLLLSTHLVAASWQNSPAQHVIVWSHLPTQGQKLYGLIHKGGPFADEKDGVIFVNRERLLPLQKRGYYREYTVTPLGTRDRGPKRIVCGGWTASVPDTCYYTDDHYASFRRIVE